MARSCVRVTRADRRERKPGAGGGGVPAESSQDLGKQVSSLSHSCVCLVGVFISGVARPEVVRCWWPTVHP